jgi:SAM-dependent methyltransferase
MTFETRETLKKVAASPFRQSIPRDGSKTLDERRDEVLPMIRDKGVAELAEALIDLIDPDRLEALREQQRPIAEVRGDNYGFKYLDSPFWAAKAAQFALALGLGEGPKRRVLDLGCGAGFFCAACRTLGHEAVATDIRNRLYDDIAGLIGVNRVELRVDPMTPLPRLGEPFDLVSGYAILFDRVQDENGERRMWDRAEWVYFLHDLATDKLTADGRIMLLLNRQLASFAGQTDRVYDPVILELAEQLGAFVTSPAMHFENSGTLREALKAEMARS